MNFATPPFFSRDLREIGKRLTQGAASDDDLVEGGILGAWVPQRFTPSVRVTRSEPDTIISQNIHNRAALISKDIQHVLQDNSDLIFDVLLQNSDKLVRTIEAANSDSGPV
jgi:hypothetical protein